MAGDGSIKFFRFLQKFYGVIGIHRAKANQLDRHFVNSKNCIFIASAASMLISSLAFLAYQAENTFDFGLSFLYSSALTAGGILYAIFTWKIENVFRFIANCDAFIEQSKCNNLTILTRPSQCLSNYARAQCKRTRWRYNALTASINVVAKKWGW